MSKLQKLCANSTGICTLAQPSGCLYTMPPGTPQVSPPLGTQFLCCDQRSLWGIPSANAKVLVLPTYLPTTGEGWQKATRHEKACLLDGQNLDYHCHCPPKTLVKFRKQAGQ